MTTTELDLTSGRPIDSGTAFAHIGAWTLIRVGAVDKYRHKDHIQFDMTVDGGRKRRVLVQLNRRDLYNVEVGRLKRQNFSLVWASMFVRYDISATDLSSTIEEAFEYVMS